ncbi:MAG: hypothetical protein C4523_14050 [Myxococcales bacterium]|nr:MAG: hypothetical protein C4523_14050 [Myxococcales bacterium]
MQWRLSKFKILYEWLAKLLNYNNVGPIYALLMIFQVVLYARREVIDVEKLNIDYFVVNLGLFLSIPATVILEKIKHMRLVATLVAAMCYPYIMLYYEGRTELFGCDDPLAVGINPEEYEINRMFLFITYFASVSFLISLPWKAFWARLHKKNNNND